MASVKPLWPYMAVAPAALLRALAPLAPSLVPSLAHAPLVGPLLASALPMNGMDGGVTEDDEDEIEEEDDDEEEEEEEEEEERVYHEGTAEMGTAELYHEGLVEGERGNKRARGERSESHGFENGDGDGDGDSHDVFSNELPFSLPPAEAEPSGGVFFDALRRLRLDESGGEWGVAQTLPALLAGAIPEVGISTYCPPRCRHAFGTLVS